MSGGQKAAFESAIDAAAAAEPKLRDADAELTDAQKEILHRIRQEVIAVVFNGADDLLTAGMELPFAINAAGVHIPFDVAALNATLVCGIEKRQPNRALWCQSALRYLDAAEKNFDENVRPHMGKGSA